MDTHIRKMALSTRQKQWRTILKTPSLIKETKRMEDMESVQETLSPEVAELIAYRERIARIETLQLKATMGTMNVAPTMEKKRCAASVACIASEQRVGYDGRAEAGPYDGGRDKSGPYAGPYDGLAIQGAGNRGGGGRDKSGPYDVFRQIKFGGLLRCVFSALQRRIRSSWSIRGRRVPLLLQVSMVECGAACLAMVLCYYGRKSSISEVRERCGMGRDGLSALSIVKVARAYGLRTRALSLQVEDVRSVPLPAIAHWEFNHFLIIERWSPDFIDVVDPAAGRRRLSMEEFDLGFTGVMILLEPGAHFQGESSGKALTVRSYLLHYMKQAPVALLQILGASLLLQLLGLVVPLLTAVAIDQLIPAKMSDVLSLFGLGMLLLVLAQFITSLLRASILVYVQARIDTRMMLNFFEHLLSLPHSFFLQRSSGDLLTRVSSNMIIRDTVSNQLISTILDGSFVLIYLGILFSQSLPFTLVVLVIGILQSVLLLSVRSRFGELTRRELTAGGKSQGYLTEMLVGVKTLKSVGAEQSALERWSNLFFEQMNISVRRNYLSSLITITVSALNVCAPLVLLWLGTMEVIAGSMQVGAMLALSALAGALLTPLSSLVSSGTQLQLIQSHLERIADVIDAEPEQNGYQVADPPKLTGSIRLEKVSFQYDPQAPVVLRNINLSIRPGQRVAIVGRTGSGKSTLGSLILGLCIPTKGEILYDGIPLRSLNYQAVRTQFGVVTQEASIFSGSVRENITLSDATLSMERVIKAAKAAALHDDIMKMPMQYETFVSEGGNALSGGQRQRLALARALVREPVILLLDEATSSLDVLTEQVIEHNIQRLSCAQIIIAHRLSTIRNADLIVVMHQGEIVEQGSHVELLKWGGYYAQLLRNQEVEGKTNGGQRALFRERRQFIQIDSDLLEETHIPTANEATAVGTRFIASVAQAVGKEEYVQ